jgi:hypothetical protein
MPDIPEMTEIGSTGLKHSGGYVREEFLKELRGQNKYEIFNEMRKNDPVVGGVLTAIKSLMRQADWKTERGEARTSKANRARDFLQSNIEDLHPGWENTLSDILTMVPFGHSLHEIVLKRREGHKANPVKSSQFNDGRIGLAHLPIRQQETIWKWEFNEHDYVEAAIQKPDYGERVKIPRKKFINFKPENARNNPEGKSALRTAYRAWYFKKRIQEIEAIGIERDLAGMPKFEVPAEMLQDDASDEMKATVNELENIVKNIRRDEQEGLVVPQIIDDETGEKLFDYSLMSAGGERQFNINDIVKRYDQRIAMTTLADFILIGHESVGSFALANSKTSSFALALEAWLDVIEDKLNNKLVPMLFRLNDFDLDKKEMPKLKHS